LRRSICMELCRWSSRSCCRVLVLYLIYMDQGISLWFIIHLVVALMVWGGSGSYSARRRRYRDA